MCSLEMPPRRGKEEEEESDHKQYSVQVIVRRWKEVADSDRSKEKAKSMWQTLCYCQGCRNQ